MEIRITPSAAEALKAKIAEKGEKKAVRVYVSGVGWGGPSFGLTLDEPKNTDNIYEIEGIKVIFEKDFEPYTKGFVIDYRASIFGKRFAIDQLYSTSSCR